MKKQVFFAAGLVLSLVLSSAMPTVVLASENQSEENRVENTQKETNNELSQNVIDRADQFVQVKGNQYVLSDNAKEEFSDSEIIQIQKTLSGANAEVKHENALIDPYDKSFTPNSNNASPFVSFASTSKKYTYRVFWWGTRFYFRSNAAVSQMVHELKTSATNLAAFSLGTNASAMVAGPTAIIPGMLLGFASWKYNKIADNLQYYNETHKKHQIYMDVNMTGSSSCHILK